MSQKIPCKNMDVMSYICSKTKRYCINCNGYEAMEFVNAGDDVGQTIKIPEIAKVSKKRINTEVK